MNTVGTEREAAEDVFFGQVVIIWARWFLIVAGAVLALWTTHDSTALAVAVLPIVALMAMNFYLHGRYLLERPSNRAQITAASLLDLALITALVILWHDVVPSGAGSRTRSSSSTTRSCSPSRSSCRAGLLSSTRVSWSASTRRRACPTSHGVVDAKVLTLRLVTLAAMGGLGTFYWRIQRDRRRAALAAS